MNRKNQRSKILGLLLGGGWIPLPDILALGVAQYSARIHELRALGFRIENRKERIKGALHTYFRLNGGSATIEPPASKDEASRPAQAREWIARARTEPKPESGSLFGDLSPERYPD